MFQHVIVGVDGEPGGRDAIALATRLTAPNGRLKLAHVYDQTISGMIAYAITGTQAHADRDKAMQLLERESEAAGVEGGLICQPSSSVGRGLHDVAERTHADLLVVGSSRRGFPGRVLRPATAPTRRSTAPRAPSPSRRSATPTPPGRSRRSASATARRPTARRRSRWLATSPGAAVPAYGRWRSWSCPAGPTGSAPATSWLMSCGTCSAPHRSASMPWTESRARR